MAIAALVAGISCGEDSKEPEAPEPLRGLADFHSHQFGELGFSGALIDHSVDPTQACKAVLSSNPGTLVLSELVKDGIVGEAAEQAKEGKCYPTATNRAGQQMDTDSLERAWRYGLRLLVVFAVNSEFLCRVTGLDAITCRDAATIDQQLTAAKDLERSLDTAFGGAGKGWYRVVYSPKEARDVIRAGQLAVVLGVETSNAFGGCNIVSGGTTAAVRPPTWPLDNNPDQELLRLDCSTSLRSLPGGGTARAVALLEHHRELGARHFFLIHNVTGIAGGHALSIPLMHAMNNPVRREKGALLDRVDEINRVVTEARLQFGPHDCSDQFAFDGGSCNAAGLTFTGLTLAKAMASHGSLIDIDHLSQRSKLDLLNPEIGLGSTYPLVSSHSGFTAIASGDKKHEGQLTPDDFAQLVQRGGAVAPILLQGTATSEIAKYPPDAARIDNDCAGTSQTWAQAYRYAVDFIASHSAAHSSPIGVGFGSDFNGLAGWPRPRFDNHPSNGWSLHLDEAYVGPDLTSVGGRCYPESEASAEGRERVAYPFRSPMTGTSFDRAVLSWSGRNEPYDVAVDGVAHVGLIPDFVEEMRVMGLSDADLDPLWFGAEAYIRTWEKALAAADDYGSERSRGIEEKCRAARAPLVADAPDASSGDDSDTSSIAATIETWSNALAKQRELGCDYTAE